ncbi:VOC family protein [Streptomyces sp. NBC_01476]|uniref:VOC family protein n=1 Tax=Streptomyces sp. NBC_01476 TaxID=2903881 RepID=UPI002E2F233A|nr:VOC family protein [Streptomyces sp. NBC_01476]
MIGTLGAVVLDCPDPKALAAFYAELVGGTVDAEDDEWVDLNREGAQRLSFQLAPGHQAPSWPDPGRPQQFHLDIAVPRAEMDAAEGRVLDLGATLLEGDQEGSRNWRVYADPAGHPFCLCAC